MKLHLEMVLNGKGTLEAPTKIRGAELEQLVGLQPDDALVLRKIAGSKPLVTRVANKEVYDLREWDEVLIVTCLALIRDLRGAPNGQPHGEDPA